MINKQDYSIAYLSMEIAIENNIKTYAGGLGILAGDILKSAAEKKFPMIGVTLLSRQGYFKQKINSSGDQIELIDRDYDFSLLKKLDLEVTVNIGAEEVRVGVWQYIISGSKNFEIPVYFLDTNIRGNKTVHKNLTAKLYGGDTEFRLRQEIILGRGGVKIIQALGYSHIKKYHLNEGHASFVPIELFSEASAMSDSDKINKVKKQCVFTTHTPIKTIYDEFSLQMLLKNQPDFPANLPDLIKDQKINTLELGIYFSAFINGVSKMHRELLNNIFPDKDIKAVTNGVNSVFWTTEGFKNIYDKYLPGWREDNPLLRRADKIPSADIWSAHQKNKKQLLAYLKKNKKINWQENIFTIGFARRFTNYKQPLLLFIDLERLIEILEAGGGAQIILAGKAHLRDTSGQEAIKKIYQIKKNYPKLNVVFLENYNLDLARLIIAGVDLWLNTPLPPQEACGTSGMKAAHNGVPQLSTLDGWWPEGYKKDKTGWAFSGADELYEVLKKEIMPLYYQSPVKWQEIMKNVISFNASWFNTGRVLDQYIQEVYK
jgi:starch phosphorylase